MFWESQEEYVRTECHRAAQLHVKPRGFFFSSCVLGLRTNQKKTFKSILEATETAVYYGQRFIMGTKNNLSWFFIKSSGFKIFKDSKYKIQKIQNIYKIQNISPMFFGLKVG